MSIIPTYDVALEMATMISRAAREVAAGNNRGEREMVGAAFTEFADRLDRFICKTVEILNEHQ